MFKILDKQGGEVTASQQAVFNKISTNNADGYVDGFLNNLNIAVMSSNMISIDSGLLSIQGFRSVNDTLATYTVSVTPSEPIPFQLVATYSHFISDENDTLEITTRPVQDLRREPLFSGQNAVYEVELAEFTMTADGITDLKATLEKIVYNEQDLSELLDKVTKAEADSAEAKEIASGLADSIAEANTTAQQAVSTANEASQTANQAKSTAESAVSTANQAKSTAESATTTANKASQTANGAVSTANQASQTANQANSTAKSAVSTANQATQTAGSATTTANQAKSTAESAVSTANQANTTADSAKSTAEQAKTTADGLAGSIAQANTTADSAKSTAEQAKTTADGLAGSIAQANTTAEQANSTANTAKSTADNALAGLAGKQPKPTTIYDYSNNDPAINLGYPNGICGGTTLNYDFTKWSKIKVYVTFNWNTIGITECDLNSVVADYVSDYMDEDRRYSIALLTETSKALFSMRLRLPKDKQSLIFETIGYISGTVWAERNNSTERERNNIYKIEGIK